MVYKNVICLIVGVVIGIRLTDFWDYVDLQSLYTTTTATTSTTGGGIPAGFAIDDDDVPQYIVEASGYLTSASSSSSSSNRPMTTSNGDTELTILPPPTTIPLNDILYNETRVLCWIMTAPMNHERAQHVRNTWGRRCNKLLFMSTASGEAAMLETVQLNVSEGRAYLWQKTREAFAYIYDNHFNEADWFVKADDDTYFIVENLRAFLYPFDANAPVYFGCKFHPFVKQGYMSGGAGYVLSKEALRRFATIGYPNAAICSQKHHSEDKEMGVCMENLGVIAGDSRDSEGYERFLPLAPHHLIPFDASEWFSSYLFYKPTKVDTPCCSSTAISFHYIKPKEFYTLEYIIYMVRAFGVRRPPDKLPDKVNMTAMLEKWRKDRPHIS